MKTHNINEISSTDLGARNCSVIIHRTFRERIRNMQLKEAAKRWQGRLYVSIMLFEHNMKTLQ